MDTAIHSRDEVLAWLRLSLVPGVGPAAQRALLDAFVTPHAIVDAPRGRIADVAGNRVAELLAKGPEPELVERTLRWLEGRDRHLIAHGDARFPAAWREIPVPPVVFYAQGRVELLNAPAFAVVGSRNATPQGLRDAEAFARALSDAGLTIVSGLALGIDAAAHRGGLAGASSSVAVMGTGPDIIYPRPNHALAHALASRGCLVSEFAVGSPAVAGNFPRRNRLISGLSRGVLVVEAALPSGSLSTARLALDQSRDVFAVPGSIHSPLSKGCHWLLKEGAKLVESAEDILTELRFGPPRPEAESPAPRPAAECDTLLEAMGFAPTSVDQMAQRIGLDAATLAARLSRLQLSGAIEALPGGWFQRVATHVIE